MDAGVGERLADRAEGVAALAQALDLVVEGEGLSGQTSRRAGGQQRGHGFKDVERVEKTGDRTVCGSSKLGVGFAWAGRMNLLTLPSKYIHRLTIEWKYEFHRIRL